MKITVTAPNGGSVAFFSKIASKTSEIATSPRYIYLVKYYQDNRTENCIPKK